MGALWVWTRCQWRRRRGGAFAATLLFACGTSAPEPLAVIPGVERIV